MNNVYCIMNNGVKIINQKSKCKILESPWAMLFYIYCEGKKVREGGFSSVGGCVL